MKPARLGRYTVALTPLALLLGASSTALAQGTTCATATVVTSGNTYAGNTATTGVVLAQSTNCASSNASKALWYRYDAPANGAITFDTCSASTAYDTTLSVFTVCNGAQLTNGCDDDSCGTANRSSLTITVAGGTSYYIRVSGWNGASGAYVLSVGPLGPPPPPPPPRTPGPDVATWRVESWGRYSPVGAITPFAIGSTSYNPGDTPVDWRDGDGTTARNTSPVIAQNMYKLKNGRFTQIGQSFVKHGFSSTNSTDPGLTNPSCTSPPLGGNQLGINCTDTYGNGLNGTQGYLGARSIVNPTTGYFAPVVNGTMSTGDTIFKRLQTPTSELEASNGTTIRYFGEIYYVTYDDATWGNALNNATHIESTLSGAAGTPANSGTQYRGDPAIKAWGRIDPAVTTVNADHTFTLTAYGSQGDGNTAYPTLPRDITCRYIVAAKATDNGNGTWHYDYCIYNHNSDRAAYSYTVHLPFGAATSNESVAFPLSHSGEPYSNGTWIVDKSTPGLLVFKADNNYATNPSANAIRWGTMYTISFDASVPPITGQGRITLFKPTYSGADPSSLSPAGRTGNDLSLFAFANALPVPRYCIPDIAGLGGTVGPDGQVTVDDLVLYLNVFFSSNLMVADIAGLGGTAGADGQITVDDLVFYLAQFFTPSNCN